MNQGWLILLVCFSIRIACAGPVSEIEVTPDPLKNGSQIFTIRFIPAETRTYEKLNFDCTYRQEYPNLSSHQPTGNKVVEPAAFSYRIRDVKMVDSLDCNISFRVPVDVQKLQEIYGEHLFNTNYPAVVSKIKVTAYEKETVLWSYDLKPEGLQEFPDTPAPVKR